MVNCNPETVSTDYDTADRLYFEPLTFEDVMAVIETERAAGADVSCLVQFGGQTPLKLALALQDAGVTILGTSPDSIDLAEDRQRFSQLLVGLGSRSRPAAPPPRARRRAKSPPRSASRWSCGRRTCSAAAPWRSSTTSATLDRYMASAVDVSHERPVLIDRFLEDANEIDVDCVADATGAVVIGGIMEHIEEAGIHSGDSSCVVPPFMWPSGTSRTIRDYTRRIARALKVVGLMNVAVRDQGRRRLRARGEPARVAHRAVSVEGHRRAAGEDGRAGDGGPDAGRAGADRGPRASPACS